MQAAGKLSFDSKLGQMAQQHAVYLADLGELSHTSANGEAIESRAQNAGVEWLSLGENLAGGYEHAQQAHVGWLDSAEHCQNIMSADYDKIGVGYTNGYWVVVFSGGQP